MEYKELSNGLKIPVIGIGTWGIGGNIESDTSMEKKEIPAIQEGIRLGMTHIDTAEIYGQGQAEKEVGIAIKDFDRKKLFIATKVWNSNLHYNDTIRALENSLKRLQTNYVDLYMIHWPNPDIPITETMEAMEHLADNGKVKTIGVSNFSVSQLKQAMKCLKKHKLAACQTEYNLLARSADKEIIPFCQQNDIMVIAYRPLGVGKLTNKGIGVLDDIAKKYNKTNAQIALKWVISHKNMVAISKSSDINHLKQNIGVLGWDLKPDDKELLDKISYPQ